MFPQMGVPILIMHFFIIFIRFSSVGVPPLTETPKHLGLSTEVRTRFLSSTVLVARKRGYWRAPRGAQERHLVHCYHWIEPYIYILVGGFPPPSKILVNGKDYPIYYGK